MAVLEVQPRETPAERADDEISVEVEEPLAAYADRLEEWVDPLQHWELSFREGHEFGRANNVEARLLFAGAEHTCSLSFRLDQVERVEEFDGDLWLVFEDRDGIAKAAHLAPGGLDVELTHVVGPPLGGTAS
jgi:hypothetical protein